MLLKHPVTEADNLNMQCRRVRIYEYAKKTKTYTLFIPNWLFIAN
jgi:hypothetical protein